MQSAASSVTGTVEIPRPNIVVGQPSTLPVPGASVEALGENDVVAVATTDENGRYELRLSPGTYLIRVKAAVQSKNLGETVTIFTGRDADRQVHRPDDSSDPVTLPSGACPMGQS